MSEEREEKVTCFSKPAANTVGPYHLPTNHKNRFDQKPFLKNKLGNHKIFLTSLNMTQFSLGCNTFSLIADIFPYFGSSSFIATPAELKSPTWTKSVLSPDSGLISTIVLVNLSLGWFWCPLLNR